MFNTGDFVRYVGSNPNILQMSRLTGGFCEVYSRVQGTNKLVIKFSNENGEIGGAVVSSKNLLRSKK